MADLKSSDRFQVIGDNRTWKVVKVTKTKVLGEWRGPGAHYWPGHKYALMWHERSNIKE